MIEQVPPSALPAWLRAQSQAAGGAQPVVLDVREPWEIEAASVKADGFALTAIPMNDVPSRLAQLDPAVPVAVLCHRGARSQRVAQFLVEHGFERVANIAGGIVDWNEARDAAQARI